MIMVQICLMLNTTQKSACLGTKIQVWKVLPITSSGQKVTKTNAKDKANATKKNNEN